MIPSLGPTVAAWPLAARAAAYTAVWVAHSFLLQLAIAGIGALALRAKIMKKTTRVPQHKLLDIALADAWGFCGGLAGVGIMHVSVSAPARRGGGRPRAVRGARSVTEGERRAAQRRAGRGCRQRRFARGGTRGR